MAELETEDVLKNIKEDLALDNYNQDTVLKRLIQKVIDHFKFEYKQEAVDDRFSFIIEDCVIKRFNRRKAEGAKTVSVEGHSVTYEDRFEFEPYHTQLLEEFNGKKDNSIRPGKVMWG